MKLALGLLITFTLSFISVAKADTVDCSNPVEQSEINHCACEDADRSQSKLETMFNTDLRKAKTVTTKQKVNLRSLITKKNMINIDLCAIDGDIQAEGGSMRPAIVCGCINEKTKSLIEELELMIVE